MNELENQGSKGRFDVVLPHGPAASYRKNTVRNPTTLLNRSNGHLAEEEEDRLALNPAANSGDSSNGAKSGSQATDDSSS
jgi:hypothetical protein